MEIENYPLQILSVVRIGTNDVTYADDWIVTTNAGVSAFYGCTFQHLPEFVRSFLVTHADDDKTTFINYDRPCFQVLVTEK